jgi:hypothetical protein
MACPGNKHATAGEATQNIARNATTMANVRRIVSSLSVALFKCK